MSKLRATNSKDNISVFYLPFVKLVSFFYPLLDLSAPCAWPPFIRPISLQKSRAIIKIYARGDYVPSRDNNVDKQ